MEQSRSTNEILRDLNKGPKYERRTIEKPYMDVFKGKMILHVPYGEGNHDFAFGIEKAEAIDKIVQKGDWNAMIKIMREEQAKLNTKKEDVIQL